MLFMSSFLKRTTGADKCRCHKLGSSKRHIEITDDTSASKFGHVHDRELAHDVALVHFGDVVVAHGPVNIPTTLVHNTQSVLKLANLPTSNGFLKRATVIYAQGREVLVPQDL